MDLKKLVTAIFTCRQDLDEDYGNTEFHEEQKETFCPLLFSDCLAFLSRKQRASDEIWHVPFIPTTASDEYGTLNDFHSRPLTFNPRRTVHRKNEFEKKCLRRNSKRNIWCEKDKRAEVGRLYKHQRLLFNSYFCEVSETLPKDLCLSECVKDGDQKEWKWQK